MNLSCFLAEFSIHLSEQPDYHFKMGQEKFLSPIIQILGRPFSIVQIYRLFPYFVEKFTKGSLKPEVVSVTNGQAVMRLKFSELSIAQFGPYLQGCAERVCHTTKATIAQVPATMFGQSAATIEDVCCIAEGSHPTANGTLPGPLNPQAYLLGYSQEWPSAWSMLGLTTTLAPHVPWWGHAGLSLLPMIGVPLTGRIMDLPERSSRKEAILFKNN